jgi:multidrug resistance efflux pump
MTKKRIAAFAGLAILPVVLALWLAGFDVSYQLGNYVVSDNAVVAGDVFQASAPATGQIADLLLDVGDSVEKGQGLANLMTGGPAQAPIAIPSRLTTFVRSPGAGTVTHMNVVRGQSVTVGQPVATVADLTSLWLVAQVDETSFKDVRPGQPVEVYLNALDRYFNGEVVGLVPDLPLNPQQAQARASSPSAARPVAQVPVRVAFNYGDALIYPGMTATIKIFIR